MLMSLKSEPRPVNHYTATYQLFKTSKEKVARWMGGVGEGEAKYLVCRPGCTTSQP